MAFALTSGIYTTRLYEPGISIGPDKKSMCGHCINELLCKIPLTGSSPMCGECDQSEKSSDKIQQELMGISSNMTLDIHKIQGKITQLQVQVRKIIISNCKHIMITDYSN